MKKIIPFLLILSFALTGCIEIVEKITIHSDQSGSISYRMESGDLGSLLSNFSGFFENDFEKQIKEKVNEYADKFKGLEGITNVNYTVNPKTGEFELIADFENTKALNKALYQAFGYKKKTFAPGYIKISKHKFKRNNISPYIKAYLEKEEFQMPSKQLLDFVTFRTTIELPEKAKNYKPTRAIVNNNGKTVSITYPVADILNNKTSLKYSIKY